MLKPKNAVHLFLFAAVFFSQCSTSKKTSSTGTALQATISSEGFVTCFEKGLTVNNFPVNCEASAIVYDGKNLLIANDKDMPGTRSAVFSYAVKNDTFDTTQQPVYINNALLKKASKYEDFARTPDGKYILLSTGFDRVRLGSSTWDNFNTILYWKKGDEAHSKVLTAKGHETDSTSISLRAMLTAALTSDSFPKGAPYYKIEGLAATENKLFFGVREEGKSYEQFRYKIKILSLPYRIENENIKIDNACTVVADINIDAIKPGTEQIALSSIEYNPYLKRFLILTSYENAGQLGGYLWSATEKDLQENKLYLVKNPAGQPIRFTHKSEDLAIISKHRIIVVHDDDRATLPVNGIDRQPHQAAYSIVDFE